MTRSRVLLVLLVLVGLAGLAAFLRSRRKDQVVDLTTAPVVPQQQPAATSDDALPVAGTASSDGGLGASAMEG